MSILEPLNYPLETNVLRGGWRRRLEVAEAQQSHQGRSDRRLNALNRVLSSWSRGKISTREMYYQCEGHVLDGNDVPGIVRLGSLGSPGCDNNCFSNMVRLLRSCGVPQMLHALPPSSPVSHCLPPTSVMSLLFKHNRQTFLRVWKADKASLREFWSRFLFFECWCGVQNT